MSNLGSIHTYRSEVDKIIRFGGSTKETTVRRAFSTLINAYARPRDLLLVEELDYPHIDRRIKATYLAASTAQKTKSYDMYSISH